MRSVRLIRLHYCTCFKTTTRSQTLFRLMVAVLARFGRKRLVDPSQGQAYPPGGLCKVQAGKTSPIEAVMN